MRIAETIVFIALWVITKVPDNPITGREGAAGNPVTMAIEVSQVAFVALAAAVIVHKAKEKKKALSQESRRRCF